MKQLFTLLLILSNLLGFAQNDSKAKEILDKVSEKTRSYKSITADFEFILENKEVELRDVKEGQIIIQGEKYKLSIEGVEIFCDGTSQWTYMEDAEEVNISEAGMEEDGAINPATIFSIYESGYNYLFLGEFNSGNVKTYKIDLIPTEEKEFSRVILEIDKTNSQIMNAVMYADDNRYTLTINSMNTNNLYKDSDFVFDAKNYPNVDVIDMR